MVLLYTSELFLEHDTGRGHPECPERLRYAIEHLRRKQLLERCERGEWSPLEPGALEMVHSPEHVAQIRAMAERGGGRLDSDTVMSARSYEVASSAAGAAVAAVDAVVQSPRRRALCLIRPPGHHATQNIAMGFCLFNTIALAAQRAITQHNIHRILIVDWDVHHGNGTQDIFYADPRVMFFSIHRYPFYPGTGAADEMGTGPGLGYTKNVPIKFGTPREVYRDRFNKALEESARKIQPQLVLISAGFDAHAKDPIGSLGLAVEDFIDMTHSVIEIAKTYSDNRLVSMLEGGYNLAVLAECIEAHLLQFLDS